MKVTIALYPALPRSKIKISAGIGRVCILGSLIICSALLSLGSDDIEVHSSMERDRPVKRDLLLLPTVLLKTPFTWTSKTNRGM